MKLSTNVQEFKTKGIADRLQYEVANTPHMMEILSNSLYSNKVQAVIRELSTNAFESHLRAGHNKQFDVSLPSYNDSRFCIRDYGTGLSLNELKDIYRIYGISDKGHSNDFPGCYGLGSKSPFAYTNSFTTISYQKGIKHIIENTKDESGCPSLVVLGSYETDEPNGMEISFDTKGSDDYDFLNNAEKVYQWFKVRPNINRNPEYSTLEYEIEDDNWKFSEGSSHRNKLIMGQIRYPIEGIDADFIRNGHLIIFAEIGDVDISASREKLQYTKKTEDYIKSVYVAAEFYINKQIQDELSSCKNLYEARMLCWELSKGKYNNFNNLGSIGYGNISDCNLPVELDTPVLESVGGWKGPSWRRQRKGTIKKLIPSDEINVEPGQIYLIKDVKTGHIADVKYLIDDSGEGHRKAFVIEPDNVKEFCDKMGFDESYLKNCSEIGRPKSVTTRGKTNISAAYIWNNSNNKYSWKHDSNRLSWDAVSIDLDDETGVYIPIKEWIPCEYSYNTIKALFDNLLDADKPENVIGILTNRKGKFIRHNNWKSISEFIDEIKKKYEKDFPAFKCDDVREALGYLTTIADNSAKLSKLLPKKGKLHLTTYKICGILHKLSKFDSVFRPAKTGYDGYDVNDLTKKIRARVFNKYPLLEHLANAPIKKIMDEITLYIDAKG